MVCSSEVWKTRRLCVLVLVDAKSVLAAAAGGRSSSPTLKRQMQKYIWHLAKTIGLLLEVRPRFFVKRYDFATMLAHVKLDLLVTLVAVLSHSREY